LYRQLRSDPQCPESCARPMFDAKAASIARIPSSPLNLYIISRAKCREHPVGDLPRPRGRRRIRKRSPTRLKPHLSEHARRAIVSSAACSRGRADATVVERSFTSAAALRANPRPFQLRANAVPIPHTQLRSGGPFSRRFRSWAEAAFLLDEGEPPMRPLIRSRDFPQPHPRGRNRHLIRTISPYPSGPPAYRIVPRSGSRFDQSRGCRAGASGCTHRGVWIAIGVEVIGVMTRFQHAMRSLRYVMSMLGENFHAQIVEDL